MDQNLIFFLSAVLIVGALLFAIICASKKGTRKLDVERYRVKYLEIEHQLKKNEPHSYHLSVMNADKLVDQALKERGFGGETMGERMKSAMTTFKDNNGVWSAHKLRNRIVHEPDINIGYEDARHALNSFKKALMDLGAI